MMDTSKILFSVIALVVLFAVGLPAQDLVRQITDPDAAPPRIDERVGYRTDLLQDAKSRDDDFRSERWFANLSVPIMGSSSGGIFVTPSFDYLKISTERDTLPDELVTAGLGAIGFIALDNPAKIRLGTYVQANIKSDTRETDLSEIQYLASVFAFLELNEEWHFSPGLGFVSDIAVGFLENIPIPSLEIVFTPRTGFLGDINLLVAFGLPLNIVSFKPIDWLTVNVFNLAGVLGNANATAEITDSVLLQASFNSNQEVFNLNDDDYRKDSRLLRRELEAGLILEVRLGSNFSFNLGYGYVFQRRWIIGEAIDSLVEERLDVEPGHALSITIGFGFSPAQAATRPETQ